MKNRLFEETLNDIDDAAERAILLDAWDRLGDNHAETCPLRVPQPVELDAEVAG